MLCSVVTYASKLDFFDCFILEGDQQKHYSVTYRELAVSDICIKDIV